MARLPKTKEDLKRGLPILDGKLDVRGPSGGIQIFRDGCGISHVKAEDTHDAFFGQAVKGGVIMYRRGGAKVYH